MTDRPILFSAPMARALLAERKTQTRRVLKKPAALDALAVFGPRFLSLQGNVNLVGYSVGNRLWVREAWRSKIEYDHLPGSEMPQIRSLVEYDLHVREHGSREVGRYRHARFMPRWASRLTLVVTDVRVQRLQDISEADAISEGIGRVGGGMLRWEKWSGAEGQSGTSPLSAFAVLWNSIHGPDAWSANPWIVALTFVVHRRNIDQMEGSSHD